MIERDMLETLNLLNEVKLNDQLVAGSFRGGLPGAVGKDVVSALSGSSRSGSKFFLCRTRPGLEVGLLY